MQMCSPTRKLSKACTLGIFVEAALQRHDWSSTQSPASLSFLEKGGWGWKFQASTHELVFLMTSPHPEAVQEPTKSHLKDTSIT